MNAALLGMWAGGFLMCGLLPLWMVWGGTRRNWRWMIDVACGLSLVLAWAGYMGGGGRINVGSWLGFTLTLAATFRYLNKNPRSEQPSG